MTNTSETKSRPKFITETGHEAAKRVPEIDQYKVDAKGMSSVMEKVDTIPGYSLMGVVPIGYDFLFNYRRVDLPLEVSAQADGTESENDLMPHPMTNTTATYTYTSGMPNLGTYQSGEEVQFRDVVRLNSGGPEMLVVSGLRNARVLCNWLGDGCLESSDFNIDVLTLIRRTPEPALTAVPSHVAGSLGESGFSTHGETSIPHAQVMAEVDAMLADMARSQYAVPEEPAKDRAFPMCIFSNGFLICAMAHGEPGKAVARIEKVGFALSASAMKSCDVANVVRGLAENTEGFSVVVNVLGMGALVAKALSRAGILVHEVRPKMPPFLSEEKERFRTKLDAAFARYAESGSILTGKKEIDGCACLAFVEGVTLPESAVNRVERADSAAKLTPADVEAAIASEHYYTGQIDASTDHQHRALGGILHCTLICKNGQLVTGEAFCADLDNPDHDAARKSARRRAFDKLYDMVVYANREREKMEA